MSLQRLPLELFLHIITYLPAGEDRDCLLITCRKFRSYNYLPDCPSFRPGVATENFQHFKDDGEVASRLNFLARLFLPGNEFHQQESDVAACGRCCVIRPLAKFPLEMTRDGHRTCEDCIATIMGEDMDVGCLMVYNGKKYRGCKHCGEILREDDLHLHYTPSSVENMCEDCHFDYCSDVQCGGWPVQTFRAVPWHFCTRRDEQSDSGCGECASCSTIAMMECSKNRKQE